MLNVCGIAPAANSEPEMLPGTQARYLRGATQRVPCLDVVAAAGLGAPLM